MALKVGELYALFTLDQSQVDTALDSIRGKLTGMSTSFTRAGTLWTHALTRPILDFGKDSVNAAMDYGKEMSNAMAKFGFDMNTPEGVAEYEKAYAALDAEVMRVAKDSVYTTDETAGAIDKMAMAGWSWEASIAALEPIMDLAAASGEDVVTVSDIVTDAMTAMGYTWESAGGDMDTFTGMVKHFTNVLATAATASNTDIGMMGESFKYAATMAGTMGYSIDDVAVALGLMANRGTKASQAGTSLRAMLTNLINPKGEDRNEAIEMLGLDLRYDENGLLDFKSFMDQIRQRFSELHIDDIDQYTKEVQALGEKYPELEEAAEVMAKIQALGGNRVLGEDGTYRWAFDFLGHSKEEIAEAQRLIEEYDLQLMELFAADDELNNLNERWSKSQDTPEALMTAQFAANIGGVRGMLALLAIATASEEEYLGLVNEVAEADAGEGRTHEMKEMQLDNSKGSLEKFLSSVQVLKTEIGGLINESLTPMIDKAKEIVDNFIEMDDEQKKSIMDVVGLAAAIGPALIGVGALAKLLPALGTAFSFLTSPMGLIVALFGAMAFSALDAEGNITNGMKGIADALGIDTSGLNLEDFDLDAKLEEMMGGAVDFANSPTVTSFMTKLGEGLQAAIAKIGSLDGEKLISTLIGTITGLAESEGVQMFMKNMGDAFRSGMGQLGNLTGEIVGYIFSPAGLTQIFKAGVTVGKLVIEGLVNGIAGFGNFVANAIEAALVGLGVLSQEELDAAKEAGKQLATTTAEAYEGATAGEKRLIDWANFYGGQNRSELDAAAQDAATSFNGLLRDAAKRAGTGEEFRDEVLANMFWNNEDWMKQAEANGFNIWDENLNVAEVMKSILGSENLDDILPAFEDLDFWGKMLEAINSGKQSEVMQVVSDLLAKAAAGAETPEAGETPAPGTEEVSAATQELVENGAVMKDAAGNIQTSTDEIVTAMANGASAISQTGLVTAVTENTGAVETAALTVADAAVQQFLLTMSAENGNAIGTNFVNGIINAVTVTGGLLINAAGVMAASAHNAAQAAMSYASAFRIGKNFGQGLVNGINAMIGAVADAAAAMGAAAGDSLSGSIDEGSPSRLTAKSGVNFGLGFINAVLGSAAAAGQAAALMGVTASESLAKGANALSGMAADQMSLSGRNSFSETRAAENERNAMTLGNVIASALNGARVEMNGVLVGELVTETVSEGIANRYAGMRYGTV